MSKYETAFPYEPGSCRGLTKREYYAAEAMKEYIHQAYQNNAMDNDTADRPYALIVAEKAFRMADFMIAVGNIKS